MFWEENMAEQVYVDILHNPLGKFCKLQPVWL